LGLELSCNIRPKITWFEKLNFTEDPAGESIGSAIWAGKILLEESVHETTIFSKWPGTKIPVHCLHGQQCATVQTVRRAEVWAAGRCSPQASWSAPAAHGTRDYFTPLCTIPRHRETVGFSGGLLLSARLQHPGAHVGPNSRVKNVAVSRLDAPQVNSTDFDAFYFSRPPSGSGRRCVESTGATSSCSTAPVLGTRRPTARVAFSGSPKTSWRPCSTRSWPASKRRRSMQPWLWENQGRPVARNLHEAGRPKLKCLFLWNFLCCCILYSLYQSKIKLTGIVVNFALKSIPFHS